MAANFKFMKLKKLKAMDDQTWTERTSDDLDEEHEHFQALSGDLTARFNGDADHPWDAYKDFMKMGGIPCFQVYDSVYGDYGYTVQVSTVATPFDSADYVGPRTWVENLKDLDGNETGETKDVDEHTSLNHLLDTETRNKMTTMCFNQKKFKRVGPALPTPGFIGKADGYSIYVAHIHVPNTDTKAEIASQGFATQGGFIVCLAPDNTKTVDDMNADAAAWAPAGAMAAVFNELGASKGVMDSRQMKTFVEGFLDWIGDFANYKYE